MWCVFALLFAGCWTDDFSTTRDVALREQFALPAYDACLPSLRRDVCDAAASLGRALFFEPALSGTGAVACTTCHDPKGAFVDTRTENAVSFGTAKWTAHNTISVVNIGLKYDFGDGAPFTWTGQCQDRPCLSPGAVIQDIALPRAMASSPQIVGNLMRTLYTGEYMAAFTDPMSDDTVIQRNVLTALDAYMRRLVSVNAPFDGVLGPAAQRGFELFVGRAMCVECHRGPLFSDFRPHVTGVAQTGAHAPTTDFGIAGTGAFLTPPLRNVASTAPYMHDGSLRTLDEVVDFYRWGGATSGFVGTKDSLMQPLDIDDNDAHDLVAFLQALSGKPVDPSLVVDHHKSRTMP